MAALGRNTANVATAALSQSGTYIGSVEKHTRRTLWVYENDEMVHRSVSYSPDLLCIFDEILVKVADIKQRDQSMNSLKVTIDVEQNLISMYYNGSGVPVMMHGKEGFYEFVIETAVEQVFNRVFHDHSETKSDYTTGCEGSENWTRVLFKPVLAKFNMTELEGDVVALMKKRVVDMAGIVGKSVKVELNGKCIPVNSFTDYVSLYLQAASKSESDAADLPMFAEKFGDRWEVCVSLSKGQFQQVSFVNGVATVKGGTHVDYITNQIINHLMAVVNNNNANIKALTVKSYLWVFVNSMIDDPVFDSLTKETLTTCPNSFGSICELTPEFLKKVEKSELVSILLNVVISKQSEDLNRAKKRRVIGIDRLVDANEAGGKNSDKCTLILTVGDLTMSLALDGISAVGRDHFGVYSLRKKLLNVSKDSSYDQLLMENAEIQHIKQILGLQDGKEYDSVKSLRYGHLMIMTNQDPDGSHSKGLLIYFIHSFWPSLLRIRSFLVEFIAPVVKATHRNGMIKPFDSIPEYVSWKENLRGDASSWTTEYYKVFGSCTAKEVKEYFSDLDNHKKDFVWEDEQDDVAIKLAFSKITKERKDWLRQLEPGTYLDRKKNLTRFKDFVYKELILFPMEKLQQVIPSMVDGLKPCQRKILFCCLKFNFVKQISVSELYGCVIDHSAYHHGVARLGSTIIGMAQNFMGSNNINLLHPIGRFGSRHHGGRDHVNACYLHVKLSPITRYLFHKDDDIFLDYLNEYGGSIEPTWYMPVIPTVLINGSEGTGTEWSTYIPKYNPRDIVANTKRFLNGKPMEPMIPWYKGFRGIIEKSATEEGGVSYTCTGIIEVIDRSTLHITELPVGQCTEEYVEWLYTKLIGHDKAVEPFIEDILVNNGGDTGVHIELILSSEEMAKVNSECLLEKFNLTREISTSNMHLFDSKGVIKKYDTPEQIIEEFCHLRLAFYEKRKEALVENRELELLKLENKARFISEVLEGNILVVNRKKADVIDELWKKKFTSFPMAGVSDVIEQGKKKFTAGGEWWRTIITPFSKGSDYDYLLSLLCKGALTAEEVQQLNAERGEKLVKLGKLKNESSKSLWIQDLNALDSQT